MHKIRKIRHACLVSLMLLATLSCDDHEQQTHVGQSIDLGLELDHDLELDQEINQELDQTIVLEPDFGGIDLGGPTEPPSWSPPLGDREGHFKLRVLLDNQLLANAKISQGGSERTWLSDAQGEAWIELDTLAISPLVMFAAHPEARTKSIEVQANQVEGVTIALTRFKTPDQPNYPYSDPGEPSRRNTTTQCGHCHLDINDTWFASPHSRSAKNPIVYDLYTGRGSGHQSQESCLEQGGTWTLATLPESDEQAEQCFFDLSALKAFNPSCDTPCNTNELGSQAYYGGCADCHAPTINGLSGGGHDLSKVTGQGYEYGISCDLCHHVESLDLEAEAGVAGRLKIQRPRERGSPALGGGGFKPLSFGPHADVSNPRMGISPRKHFRNGELCGGCHQHQHTQEHNPPLIDRIRWPEGELPNQSTYQEWLESPFNQNQTQKLACNSCHMPPIASVMNSANIEYFTDADIGVQGGWPRPFGETRSHAWWGPRQPEHPILNLSAHLSLSDLQIEERTDGSRILVTQASVSNVGAGHGLPTGEPMRHILLVVEASCADQALSPIGGDVVHNIGGAVAERSWAEALDHWPEAQVGDELRVVRILDDYYDYDGYGAFREPNLDQARGLNENDRVFAVNEKGLAKEQAVGSARVQEIINGQLRLSQEINAQANDRVYLHRPQENGPKSYAGYSGFSFARVLTGDQALPMLPHFVAQDLQRDNRLRPNQSWTSQHRFELSNHCQDPQVKARLIYRPYPWWLAVQRAWHMWDREIRSVTRSMDESVFLENINTSQELSQRLHHPEHNQIWITLPSSLSLEELSPQLSIVRVDLDALDMAQATRRAEAWPWEVQAYRMATDNDPSSMMWATLNSDDELTGPIALFNESDQPLALEPNEQFTQVGASIDSSLVPINVLRSTPSQAESLWVIPPLSGVLLLPKVNGSAQTLMAAGYTAQGGRSWVSSSPLFTLKTNEASSLGTVSNEPVSPHIVRQALLDESHLERAELNIKLKKLLGRSSMVMSYQGSDRINRWHTNFRMSEDLSQASAQHGLLVSVRNLSTRGQAFGLFGHSHRQWVPHHGWSEALTTSWLPIGGEALIYLPPLAAGTYRLGALNQVELQAEFMIQ